MTPTKLLTKHGDYVTTVMLPPFSPPCECVCWGERFFVRTANGEYREALMWFCKDESRAEAA